MSKQFIKGNVYVFIAKKVGRKSKFFVWESDINGNVVTIARKNMGFVDAYRIFPHWCKCIKNNN